MSILLKNICSIRVTCKYWYNMWQNNFMKYTNILICTSEQIITKRWTFLTMYQNISLDHGNKFHIFAHVNKLSRNDENFIWCTITFFLGVDVRFVHIVIDVQLHFYRLWEHIPFFISEQFITKAVNALKKIDNSKTFSYMNKSVLHLKKVTSKKNILKKQNI